MTVFCLGWVPVSTHCCIHTVYFLMMDCR